MRFLTTDEVAKELRVSRRSVERWIAEGLVPAIKLKSTIRVPASVISSGSIVTEGIIEQSTTDRTILLRQVQTAAYFLENATEIFDQRVLEYLDAAIALDLISGDALDGVMMKLRTLRTSLREVWQAIGEAEPKDVRLFDCGEASRLASG